MAAIMLVLALAGCGRSDADDGLAETPEFVFVPEYVTLPDGITSMDNLAYSNGRLYFSSWVFDEEAGTSANSLFAVNIDGTNFTELPNYTPPEPPEGAMGGVGINAIRVDDGGNIWVAESGSFWGLDVPEDFDGEEWEMWEFHYEIGSVMMLRKLDNTGSELLSTDVSDLTNDPHFFLRTFNIDGHGNIYVATDGAIYVLDNTGRSLFRLEVDSWIEQLVRLPDGSIAFSEWVESGRRLRTIDFASRGFGENIEIPFNARTVFTGDGVHSVIFDDGIGLSGVEADTGESVRLLSWIGSDIHGDGLENIVILPDGRVLVTNRSWNRTTGESRFEIIILTRVPYDSLPPRTIITMATVGLDWQLRGAIIQFNRTNPTYRIEVTDFMEFATADDWQAGFTRLTTELIAGRVPDILNLSRDLPFNQYVARGLLVDLYQFIDADPVLNRGDFIESVFSVTEVNGGLYKVFPNFAVSTLVGNPAVLGPNMGWNMNEFRQVLQNNPQADMPLGMGFTRESFLMQFVMMTINEHVDWAAGTTHFDSDEFVQLLEFAYTFPDEFDWDFEMDTRRDMMMEMDDLIGEGRQIMQTTWVNDFQRIQMDRATFGGDIVFKGFPTASRSGHVLETGTGLAITSRASDPDGAWAFVRTILTEEWQRENVQWNFPTNRAVFDERVEDAMTIEHYYIDEDGNKVEISVWGMGWGTMSINIYASTQQDIDQIMELIDSVSGTFNHDQDLMDIITEGAADFFSGRRTAQDAARVIQSRASIFIAERS